MSNDPNAAGPDDEIFGTSSLLDRLGTGKPVVSAPARKPARRSTTAPKHQSAKATKPSVMEVADGPSQHVRVSVYLSPDDLDELDHQVIRTRSTLGKKRDRSDLIREAVRYWLKTKAG